MNKILSFNVTITATYEDERGAIYHVQSSRILTNHQVFHNKITSGGVIQNEANISFKEVMAQLKELKAIKKYDDIKYDDIPEHAQSSPVRCDNGLYDNAIPFIGRF